MEFNQDPPIFTEEKRLVGTMITGRPPKRALLVAAGTIAIMAVMSQLYWSNFYGWSELLPAVNSKIFVDGQWWRIFTAIFIHGDFGHFLSNMYMLGIFCYFVFSYFGFSVYPLLSLLGAAAVNALASSTYPADTRLLGASGLVYLLGGFWLAIYFLIQRQYKVLNRLLRVSGIGIMVFFPSTFTPTTSYRTHAIGFAMGVALAAFYFVKKRNLIRSHEIYKVSYVESEPTLH